MASNVSRGSNVSFSNYSEKLKHLGVRAGREWELTVTCEVRGGHVLDGDLLQEGWFLTARVPAHHPGLLQPLTEPGQVTVAHIRVGQEVTVKIKERQREEGH